MALLLPSDLAAFTAAPKAMVRDEISGLLVPARYVRQPALTAIDLFAGAGGFSCGIHQAGFEVVAAVEYDLWASMTYLVNLGEREVDIYYDDRNANTIRRELERQRPKSQRTNNPDPFSSYRAKFGTGWIASDTSGQHGCQAFFLKDARTVTASAILDAVGLGVGQVDLVVGGPPCQGFSKAGKQEVMDPRNSLVFTFANLVNAIQPKAFVMENVRGILDMVTPEGVPVVDALCHLWEEGGMGVYSQLREMLVEQQHQMSAGLKAIANPTGLLDRDDLIGDDDGRLFGD